MAFVPKKKAPKGLAAATNLGNKAKGTLGSPKKYPNLLPAAKAGGKNMPNMLGGKKIKKLKY